MAFGSGTPFSGFVGASAPASPFGSTAASAPFGAQQPTPNPFGAQQPVANMCRRQASLVLRAHPPLVPQRRACSIHPTQAKLPRLECSEFRLRLASSTSRSQELVSQQQALDSKQQQVLAPQGSKAALFRFRASLNNSSGSQQSMSRIWS